MGGRGISANNQNAQINIEQYLLRLEIGAIHNKAESMRNASVDNMHRDSSGHKSGGATMQKSKRGMKRCACCRNYSIPAFTQYEICPICGWIDDPRQNSNPELEKGANLISLNEARQKWKEAIKES